jgi:hypothetical protein
VFLALGQIDQAHHVAVSTANALEPKITTKAEPEVLSLCGALHLVLAVAASRDNRRSQAREHLEIARTIADRLGQDRDDATEVDRAARELRIAEANNATRELGEAEADPAAGELDPGEDDPAIREFSFAEIDTAARELRVDEVSVVARELGTAVTVLSLRRSPRARRAAPAGTQIKMVQTPCGSLSWRWPGPSMRRSGSFLASITGMSGATAAVTAASRSRSSRQFLIGRVAPAATPGTGHQGACLLPRARAGAPSRCWTPMYSTSALAQR